MGYKALFMSFVYAFRGIVFTVRNERNMRIHLVCMAYMYYFLLRYDFFTVSRTELAVLLLANALVVGGELINTAIERAVDTATEEIRPTARIAKDTAAGAVLVFAVFAVLTGVAVLWQPEAFAALFAHFVNEPVYIALFAVSVIVFTYFIFLPKFKKENNKGRKNDR